MPRNPMPMSEVLGWLADHHPTLTSELDRNWVWVTTDLAPLHKKCECPDCLERKAIRDSLKEIGFAFAFTPHALPSGNTARWGHSCEAPTRFKRRGGKPGEETSNETMSDEELLSMIGG